MKLELKDLAPYLPYGIKVNLCDLQGELKYENRAIRSFDIRMGFKDFNLVCERSRVYYLDSIKPILRPLSDLNKNIEINERQSTIPMIKLATIAFPKSIKFEIIKDYVSLGQEYSFHFNKNELSFECMQGYNGKKWNIDCYVPNQFELFQYLFKWHFDVFGLIEKDLAINKNEL